MHKNKIGFHVKSMSDLERLTNIKGVDLVELKPDHLRRNNEELYYFDGHDFSLNERRLDKISKLCSKRGIEVQIHMPYEEKVDPLVEAGLCQTERTHHHKLLKRYEMYGEMLIQFGIGTVLTTHPPLIKVDGEQIWSEDEALETGKEFYAEVDRLIKKNNYNFKVGIENVVAPKDIGTSYLGYNPKQIDWLIGNTSEIGITVDTGHRLLNDEMSINKLIGYGEVVNCHFHANSGQVSQKDFEDDEHVFATSENLPHYGRYMKGLRRRGWPIILEISKLDKLSDDILSDYVTDLRKRLNS